MFCVVASFPYSDRFRPEYDAPCFLRKMTDAPDLSSGASKAIFFWRHHPESNRGIKVLQTSALPLGYGAVNGNSEQSLSTVPLIKKWSGLRGSNPPPLPWQGSALPNELFPQYGASEWSRTTDTGIFSPLLYQLSYRGKNWRPEGGSNP